jgi:hypothetical protein
VAREVAQAGDKAGSVTTKAPLVLWIVRGLRGDVFAREVVSSTLARTRGPWLVRVALPDSPGNAFAADWMAWLDGLPTTLQWYVVGLSTGMRARSVVDLTGPGMNGPQRRAATRSQRSGSKW